MRRKVNVFQTHNVLMSPYEGHEAVLLEWLSKLRPLFFVRHPVSPYDSPGADYDTLRLMYMTAFSDSDHPKAWVLQRNWGNAHNGICPSYGQTEEDVSTIRGFR